MSTPEKVKSLPFEKQWTSSKHVVYHMLSKHSAAREDDRILIKRVMEEYLKESGHNPLFMTAAKFLRLYTDSEKWPSFATILRHRRKWQSENPILRGDNYIARKNNQVQVQKLLDVPNDWK